MAASVSETMDAINAALGGSEYRCQTISWDDVQRGTVGGSLSCWGGNITDTRLWEKSGKLLYTVRTQNWNEKLGAVPSSDIALMAGGVQDGVPPRPVTLQDFLSQIGSHGAYAGMDRGTALNNSETDAKVSIRFQTTFLPVPDEQLGALEFAPEMYNYQTRSDDDPKNLLLLCTTQGSAIQQDGAGAKKLFHHAVDKSGRAGEVCRYWFEAERTSHKVGGAQAETAEEKADALKRGKAVSAVIGTRAMGTRFNVLMTIQVPLVQKPKPKPERPPNGKVKKGLLGLSLKSAPYKEEEAVFDESSDEEMEWDLMDSGFAGGCASAPGGLMPSPPKAAGRCRKSAAPSAPPKRGTANAARVSRGSMHDRWSGLGIKAPVRDPTQHVTVTVVIYNTVAGGVPSVDDVKAAVEDMEAQYRACGWAGKLGSDGAGFMKAELTVNDALTIASKVATQPYQPDSLAPDGGDAFPSAGGAAASDGVIQGQPTTAKEANATNKPGCVLM